VEWCGRPQILTEEDIFSSNYEEKEKYTQNATVYYLAIFARVY
jgi:hypothetical protein